jgi:ferredoxin-NADP reductase
LHRETEDAVTLRFRLPSGQALSAKPGQFLTFNWMLNRQTLARSYSISSSPSQTDSIDITVKRQGVVSSFLNDSARAGLEVVANGPYGRFFFDAAQHHSPIFFAAGSGITPILAMLRHLEETVPQTEAILFYASRDERQIIFKAELDRMAGRMPRFRWIPIITQPTADWRGEHGRISDSLVTRELVNPAGKRFFICGPAGFMTGVKEILNTLGVESSRVLQERFTASAVAPRGADVVSCTIEFVRSGKRFECTSAERLLSVAEKGGVDIPASCRIGQCGTCAARVLSGEVEMDADEGLSPALRAEGFSLLCVGHARGLVAIDA